MSRGKGAQDNTLDARARGLIEAAGARTGRVTPATRLRAHHVDLLEHAAGLDRFAGTEGLVPLRLKELAQVKAAALVGCPF